MNQIDGTCLSTGFTVIVNAIGGHTMDRMYARIEPMLNWRRDYVIIHLETNDSTKKSCTQILEELVQLKAQVENI